MAEPLPPRLLAPGPNVCNLLGVSCVPWYLGIAPAEYVDAQYAMPPIPKPPVDGRPSRSTPELLEWLSRSGVTHVLNFEPLDESSWQVEQVWKGTDLFLNRVWGRNEPIYLYRFKSTPGSKGSTGFPGRAYITNGTGRIVPKDWKSISADVRHYEWRPAGSEKASAVVTELQYPGWTVHQGTTPLVPGKEGLFRSVDVSKTSGDVVWTYRPASVYWGAAVSILTFLLLAFVAHMRFWHPKLVERMLSAFLR
jgi:hypothetical protein